jgi:hypothetical protein
MRVGVTGRWLRLFLLLIIFNAVPSIAADLAVSAGTFNILDGGGAGEAGLELRGAPLQLHFLPRFLPDPVPVAGVMATSQSLAYGYAGLRFDFPLDDRWVLTPGFAAGLFRQGDGPNLGGLVEFRSSLELARRLGAGSRLGIGFFHLSNAGIYKGNPGSESLVLTFSFGLGSFR